MNTRSLVSRRGSSTITLVSEGKCPDLRFSGANSDFRFSGSEGTQNPVLVRECGFDPLLRQSLTHQSVRCAAARRLKSHSPQPSVYLPVGLDSFPNPGCLSQKGAMRDPIDPKIAAAWLVPFLVFWGLVALWYVYG